MRIDARIPVRFGPKASLSDNEAWVSGLQSGHRFGCACCGTRSAAGLTLAALFQARATGTVPWFTGAVADEADRPAIEDALRLDPIASARYRAHKT